MDEMAELPSEVVARPRATPYRDRSFLRLRKGSSGGSGERAEGASLAALCRLCLQGVEDLIGAGARGQRLWSQCEASDRGVSAL